MNRAHGSAWALTTLASGAAAALGGVGWLVAGPSGSQAAATAAAVVVLLGVRLFRIPPTARPAPPARGDVPFADAPYARYRKLFGALSWGQVSARQFALATRPHLERLTADLLHARCGIDLRTRPDAAREVLGARVWALADPGHARSDDSNAPSVPLADVALLIDRLEQL